MSDNQKIQKVPRSEQTKQRMSEARKLLWQDQNYRGKVIQGLAESRIN